MKAIAVERKDRVNRRVSLSIRGDGIEESRISLSYDPDDADHVDLIGMAPYSGSIQRVHLEVLEILIGEARRLQQLKFRPNESTS